MKFKHIKPSYRLDIIKTVQFLITHTKHNLITILSRLSLSRATYYRLTEGILQKSHKFYPIDKLREVEIQSVLTYAKENSNYFHRELAYKMIDENIAYMSPSNVYRILKAYNLIITKKKSNLKQHFNPHDHPKAPDKLWQSDITYIPFKDKMYFLLIFIDVYSRYIPYHQLMTDMTSQTVRDNFEIAITNGQLLSKPILQTDNGSCFVGKEFKKFLLDSNITHRRIAPHCPNQNAEIERCNRTIKENLLDYPVPKTFTELEKTIEKVIN